MTSNYGYDQIYELLSATQGGTTTESYTYDPVGNRLSSLGLSPYQYNVSNELTQTPNTIYAQDANGNTTLKTDSSGSTTYTWDYENRLTSVTLPASGGTVNFKYDPLGHRIQKSFTQPGNPPTTTTTNYAYDGDNTVDEVDTSGNVVAKYAQGQSVDEPLAQSRSGTTSYYEADGLGSVTSLSNAAGALASTYTYESFGKPTASSGSITNPFQYTAREFDTETNLHYYRARYYDPVAGRFLNEDPLRFLGGKNYYIYVQNKPIIAKDPSGLTIWICSRTAFGGWLGQNVNHAFLYDDRNGKNCGMMNPPNSEGMSAGTFCTPVPGSNGQEDNVMKCCQQKAASRWWKAPFWFPWRHDCHNMADDCLKQNGLGNPGAPGGRVGCRGNCPAPAPDLAPPYPEHEHFMSGW